MGLNDNKGYDPRVLDRSNPKFTDVSSFADRWMVGALNTDDAYYSRGFEKYDIVGPLKRGTISAGDFVSIQNRAGVVVSVAADTESNDNDGDIASITVMEDMRYLPKDWRNNPTGYGYDSNGHGMTRTYVFGDSTVAEGIRNGGGDINAVPFYGSMMILKKSTSVKSTWNDICQAIDKRNAKY